MISEIMFAWSTLSMYALMVTATTRLDKAIAREISRNVFRTRSSFLYAMMENRGA